MDYDKPLIIFNARSNNPTDTPVSTHKMRSPITSYDIKDDDRELPKLSPEKYEELKLANSVVVVNDYDDEYHLSDEERKKRFQFYEAFMRITRCKRKFRKLDEFVKVFRLCLDCLKLVAENNGVYPPDKFIRLAIRGDIEVFGLQFPKYIGNDKKRVNWEYVTEFILDYSKDPSELSKVSYDPELDDCDDDIRDIFSDEDYQRLVTETDKIGKEDYTLLDEYYDEDNPPDGNIVLTADEDDNKSLLKMSPDLVRTVTDKVKEERKARIGQSLLSSLVFEITTDDFEYIEKMDRKRGYHSTSDMPQFKGDIMNRGDYKRYLYALERYEQEELTVNMNGKMRTRAELQEMEVKSMLEESGWNLRKLYKYKEDEKKLNDARKAEQRRIKELKKKLCSAEKRVDKIKSKATIEFYSKKKGKKKKTKKTDDRESE